MICHSAIRVKWSKTSAYVRRQSGARIRICDKTAAATQTKNCAKKLPTIAKERESHSHFARKCVRCCPLSGTIKRCLSNKVSLPSRRPSVHCQTDTALCAETAKERMITESNNNITPSTLRGHFWSFVKALEPFGSVLYTNTRRED